MRFVLEETVCLCSLTFSICTLRGETVHLKFPGRRLVEICPLKSRTLNVGTGFHVGGKHALLSSLENSSR